MGIILRYKDFLKTYKTRSHRIRHLKEYTYLFPIQATSALAGIIADLIGDGSLQGSPIWRADFTSRSIKELKRFEREIFNLFKKKCKIRKCNSNIYGKTWNAGLNCSPVARILFLCGVPAGQKVIQKFKLPKWIKNNRNCFRRFCQRFYSCEGSIMHEPNRRYPQIRLDMWKASNLIKDGEKFIKDICFRMKKYFGIKTTIKFPINRNKRKDGIVTRPIRIYILNTSAVKFCKKIGFEGKKQKDLKALICK